MFGNSNAPLCSFCKLYHETVTHIFFECSITQKLWKQLSSYLEEHLILPQLSLQTAFFGFLLASYLGFIENHILLIFKIYLYKSRKYERVTLDDLIKCCECNNHREMHCK